MGKSQSFKRILVFGAGAVGGYFGGRLALAGNNIYFAARGERLKAFKSRGLTLESQNGGAVSVNINAADKPEGVFDLIIISVKSRDTAQAAMACRDHLAEDGAVLSLQNGVENVHMLSGVFGADRVIGGVVFSGISVPKPGIIRYNPDAKITIGALTPQGGKFEQPLLDLFSDAGLDCSISVNISVPMWQKLVWNLSHNSLGAILSVPGGDLVENEYTRKLIKDMAEETIAAARFYGVELPPDTVDKTLTVRDSFKKYKCSTLQDVEAGRMPEIDGLMGVVVKASHEGKISAPVTEAVYNIAKFKFGKWFHIFPNLAADVLVYNGDKVLLIERKNEPYGWALPGGMVDLGEKVEHAAVRELKEETGIGLGEGSLTLLGVYSDPKRDPRGHTVGIVYYAYANQEPVAADDAKSAKYFDISDLPELAFDHAKIIQDFIKLRKSTSD